MQPSNEDGGGNCQHIDDMEVPKQDQNKSVDETTINQIDVKKDSRTNSTSTIARNPDLDSDLTSSKSASLAQNNVESPAKGQNEEQGETSPSESTTSGLVSPSSCSVSSQESQNLSHHAIGEDDKAECVVDDSKKISSDRTVTTQDVSSTSTFNINVDKTSVPLHNTTSLEKSQPKLKARKRPAGRRRSNSVPMYSAIINSTTMSLVDSSTQPMPNSSSKASHLRRGKWTIEEETYVARVIQDFNNGFLDAPAGTTLRTYLSDKLNCDPMRITKKFTGDACIGKRVFHPAVRCATSAPTIDKAQNELETLEKRWRRRLDMQRREADKKQAASMAASLAAAAAAAASAPHLHDPTSALIRLNASALPGNRVVVTRTATWLDRANAILSNRRMANEQLSKKIVQGEEVKKEMKEVEKLIKEGPIIQESSGLLLQTYSNNLNEPHSKRKVSDDRNESKESKAYSPSQMIRPRTNPHDIVKRMRKSLSANNLDLATDQIQADFNLSTGEAEDAASFIGFISSVREEAALGAPNPSTKPK